MANQKISALTAITGANVEQLADVLPIVDTSVATTKKILVSELSQAMLLNGTAQATTSGTAKDFTIPAWAKRIAVNLAGVSTNGSSPYLIQIGSGSVANTGYAGSGAFIASGSTGVSNSTVGFLAVNSPAPSNEFSGTVTLTLLDSATNTWSASGAVGDNGADCFFVGGSKALSGVLDRVRFTTLNGTDTFDAGLVNVQIS